MRGTGTASSTMPPPIVTTGENWRMMKRSPGSSSDGSGNFSRAKTSVREQVAWRREARAPRRFPSCWNESGRESRFFNARGAEASSRNCTSTRRVVAERRGRRQRHSPRQIFGARSRQIQRGPLPRNGCVGSLTVHLHSAHPNSSTGRKNFHFFFARESFRRPAFRSRPCRIPSW